MNLVPAFLLLSTLLVSPTHAAPRPAPGPGALPVAAAQEARGSDLAQLATEIDLSLRWLRAHQDPKTGAYGHGVESTALALRAFAQSPAHHARADGPFVALALDRLIALQDEAGWIADPSASEAERLASTLAAARALYLYVDPPSTAALARAVAWLAQNGVADPAATDVKYPSDVPSAERNARRLLATRAADGSWEGSEGAVVTTARAVLELSAYQGLLAPAAEPATGVRPLPGFEPASPTQVDRAIERGARFLVGAAEKGRWGAPGEPDAGLTAMVLAGLSVVPEPRPKEIQETIDGGLAWLLSLQQPDGSIHQGRMANYVTSASVLALAAAHRDAHAEPIRRAREFLVSLQADEGEGYSEDHPFYGGIGYDSQGRPDLSNLQMALEALVASGLPQDDAAFQRAVTFLERCQNRSESNDFQGQDEGAAVRPGNDGGGAYLPGESKAGFALLADGTKVPRSYGSMTYALLKGLVFAGLDKEDPRVEAAYRWVREHYTLDVNPGFESSSDPTASYQGLFYYFHSMARALAVFGTATVVDGEGVAHDWRAELAGRLLALQSKIDGSWVNENAARWWEGNPVLATSYALLALAETRARE